VILKCVHLDSGMVRNRPLLESLGSLTLAQLRSIQRRLQNQLLGMQGRCLTTAGPFIALRSSLHCELAPVVVLVLFFPKLEHDLPCHVVRRGLYFCVAMMYAPYLRGDSTLYIFGVPMPLGSFQPGPDGEPEVWIGASCLTTAVSEGKSRVYHISRASCIHETRLSSKYQYFRPVSLRSSSAQL